MRVELYVLIVWKLFARLLASAETEFTANVMINVNLIHQHLSSDTRLLHHDVIFERVRTLVCQLLDWVVNQVL